MAVLLTGGTGFVGINIAEKLLDEGIEVVLYSLNPLIAEAESSFQKRKGRYFFVKGDVLDEGLLDSTIKRYNISNIIHAAVITPNAYREMKDTKKIIEVNCIGTVNIMEAAKENNVDKVIYLSSITVFGETAFIDKSLSEYTSTPKPDTLYGITKFTSERVAIRYKELQNVNVIIARIGHVFGPWEHYTGVRDLLSPIFQATRLAVFGEKALLPRPGYISWVYSKDISGGINALLKSNSLKYNIYHLASGMVWSVEEWCKLLSKEYPKFTYEVMDHTKDCNITFHSKTDHSPLQITRLIEDTKYHPHFDIERSFDDYMEWIKRNPGFFELK